MNKSKEKSNKSLVLGDNQWFEKYLNICKTIYNNESDENELYLDILKDLCNDYIDDNIVIHLLSILEQMVPLFDNIDKVEQTVGSLINIYDSSQKSDWIRQKYLITTTVIITYHSEMTDSNWSLKQLFDGVIQLLIKNTEKSKTVIGLASSECLREIGNTSPTLLQSAYNNKQFRRDQTSILSSLLANNICGPEDIRNILSNLPNLSPIELYHTLTQLFETILTQKFQDFLSPMLFKPYLTDLTLSCEVHNFHFALQLLLSFGLELFSTLEEQKLLKQLVIVATHPSLSIAHRLLALDYTKSIVTRLKPTPLEWSVIKITGFDGPDTQEKKLMILNETPIDNQNLLIHTKPLKSMSLNNNMRATHAFYRVIHSFLSKRPDILNDIQDLLMSLIFRAPDPHIKRSILLFDLFRNLAKGTTHRLIENLRNLSETETFKNLNDFLEFMFAFEWIFKQKDLDLSEKQLVFLLTLVHNNCKRWTESSGRALDCCTAVLYYQTINEPIKQILLSTLEWLMNDRKNDLSITSLAQIYILALNTLEDDQNIKRVFNFEHQLCLDTEIIKDLSDDIPFTLNRVKNEEFSQQKFGLNEMPFSVNIFFEINIREEYKQTFEEIFGLILYFKSSDKTISEEYEIPILESTQTIPIRIELKSSVNKPFEMTVSAIFNDSNGTNYKCDVFQRESISLRDILIPINIDFMDQTMDSLCDSILSHKDSMQTVLSIRHFDSINNFLSHFDWFTTFLISDTNWFICGTAPDRLVMGVIKIVNNFVNIFLFTNNYELLPNLFNEFMQKPD